MSGSDDSAYSVKNTFVEFGQPDEADLVRGKRSQSDIGHGNFNRNPFLSPGMHAAKSPYAGPKASPSLGPVDEASPEVNFELGGLDEATHAAAAAQLSSAAHTPSLSVMASPGRGPLRHDEPAYVMPATPSPFMTSAFPPGGGNVPPMMFGGGFDVGLPPAYGDGMGGGEMDYNMQMMDGFGMHGMGFLTPEMYDPNFAAAYAAQAQGWAAAGMEYDAAAYEGLAAAQLEAADAQAIGTGELAAADEKQAASEAPTADRSAERTAERRAERAERSERGGLDRGVVRGDRERDRDRDRGGERRAKDRGDRAERGDRGDRGGREQASRSEADTGKRGGGGGGGGGGGDSAEYPKGTYTTVMLRNIPNKYTREMLTDQLNTNFDGRYDFLYLPIDFKNKCNVGYGFINFRTCADCEDFVNQFNGVDVRKCLPGLNSKKIVEVTPARVQGFSENVRRLRNSPVMNQLVDHPEWMPLLFNGSGAEELFPKPDQPLPPVKARGRGRLSHA